MFDLANGAPIRLVKSTEGTEATSAMSFRPTQIGFDYDGERVGFELNNYKLS